MCNFLITGHVSKLTWLKFQQMSYFEWNFSKWNISKWVVCLFFILIKFYWFDIDNGPFTTLSFYTWQEIASLKHGRWIYCTNVWNISVVLQLAPSRNLSVASPLLCLIVKKGYLLFCCKIGELVECLLWNDLWT